MFVPYVHVIKVSNYYDKLAKLINTIHSAGSVLHNRRYINTIMLRKWSRIHNIDG